MCTVLTSVETLPGTGTAVTLPPGVGVKNGCQATGVADWGRGVRCGVLYVAPEVPGAAVAGGMLAEGDSEGKAGAGDTGIPPPTWFVGESIYVGILRTSTG